MIEKLIEIMFSGFWCFVGALILITTIANLCLAIFTRTLRFFNIRKYGWPPEHLDADGDFRKIKKPKKKEDEKV